MLKVGIIGSGFGLYGLLPAFNSLKGCRVVSICGKKTKRLTSYCQSIGLKKIYTNWQVMLQNEDLDVLALAVIPGAQYEIAKVAIKKGVNIFAEKPLAQNFSQAKELFTLAEKNKIIHTIDFLYPEIMAWQKVKYILDKKTYGKLKQIYVNWDFLSQGIKNKQLNWKFNYKMGGGAQAYYFSHSLYYLEYYGGEILDFKSFLNFAKQNQKIIEVGADIILKFKNGIAGYAHFNCNATGLNRQHLLFQCEKAAIILENDSRTVTDFSITIYSEEGIEEISSPEEKIQNGEDERVRIVKKIAGRFIACCINKKTMMPSFKEGMRVQWLIEKVRINS